MTLLHNTRWRYYGAFRLKRGDAVMRILFVCTHNACRSVLAEVITRALGQGRLQAASAGSAPSGRIHPLTLHYLERAGYETGGLRSQGMDELGDFHPDVVITVCDSAALEPCPVWLGEAIKVHWGLPDPSHLQGSDKDRERAFVEVMDTISKRIEAMLAQPLDQLKPVEVTKLLNSLAHQSA